MQMLAHAFHYHFRAEDPKYAREKECKKIQNPKPGNKVHNIVSVIKTYSKACCRFHHLVLVQFHLFKT